MDRLLSTEHQVQKVAVKPNCERREHGNGCSLEVTRRGYFARFSRT